MNTNKNTLDFIYVKAGKIHVLAARKRDPARRTEEEKLTEAKICTLESTKVVNEKKLS
jgi:hypothetical protein